jgi:hypothetical protein
MPRIKFVLACSVLLAVVFATNGFATPVNYSYQGNPFTTLGCAVFSPLQQGCTPANWVTTSDFITAQVSADITLGVAGTYQATSWNLGVTTGPFFNPTNVICLASPCTLFSTPLSNFAGSFSIDVDDLGQVTNWSGDVQGFSFFYNIHTSLSGDIFSIEHLGGLGPSYDGGISQTPGTWTLVSVPETSSLVLLGIGLAGVVAVMFRGTSLA